MKKKIMLIMPLSGWDCTRSMGGVDSVCQLLLKGIAIDKANQYLVVGFNPFNDVKGDAAAIDLAENIRLHWYNLSGSKPTVFHKIIPNLFYQNWIVKREVMDFQPDVIHSHLPSWLLFKYNVPRQILTLHSCKTLGRQNFGILNHILYVWFSTALNLKHATVVTTVSRNIQDLLEKGHCSVFYIPNPVSDGFFYVERKKGDRQIVVLPASVIPKKRIYDALQVIERVRVSFPEIKLFIAGTCKKDAYYNELVAFIDKHKLQDNVEFLGLISVQQLCEVYSQAQAGLFLSEEETFGLAPLEMIAAGLPIVTTKVGVLKHEETFVSLGVKMVDVGDIQGAADGLLEILIAKTERSLSAADFIRRKYSLASITSQYLEVYQS